MRLVIDFDRAQGRWAGAILPEPGPDVVAVPTPFSGRLDLLRLLESLVEDASTNPSAPAKDPT
ncbi:MAG: hypothetical protein IPH81_18510 [Candidatus Microthrix sp.]|jgi:hypothetical protein|nr:hypothetical protein [Candidatus Microthrix sp.]MBK7167185.1 hypothetical protein [Candidatus Microthrix sp.]